MSSTAPCWGPLRVRESMADLPLGANRKERSAFSCRTASAHRALALDGFDSLPFFPKQKQHPDGMLFCFGAGYGNRRPICPWGQIVRSVRHPAAERQVPTGHLHWMGSIPFLFFQNKNSIPMGCCFCFGAGYGNRTRLCGLGSDHSTDELTLHWGYYNRRERKNQCLICRQRLSSFGGRKRGGSVL